eukprot:PhM_4_TR10543/c0_g1_i1/m.40130
MTSSSFVSVTLKSVSGSAVSIPVDPKWTVHEFVRCVEANRGYEQGSCRLMLNGRALPAHDTQLRLVDFAHVTTDGAELSALSFLCVGKRSSGAATIKKQVVADDEVSSIPNELDLDDSLLRDLDALTDITTLSNSERFSDLLRMLRSGAQFVQAFIRLARERCPRFIDLARENVEVFFAILNPSAAAATTAAANQAPSSSRSKVDWLHGAEVHYHAACTLLAQDRDMDSVKGHLRAASDAIVRCRASREGSALPAELDELSVLVHSDWAALQRDAMCINGLIEVGERMRFCAKPNGTDVSSSQADDLIRRSHFSLSELARDLNGHVVYVMCIDTFHSQEMLLIEADPSGSEDIVSVDTELTSVLAAASMLERVSSATSSHSLHGLKNFSVWHSKAKALFEDLVRPIEHSLHPHIETHFIFSCLERVLPVSGLLNDDGKYLVELCVPVIHPDYVSIRDHIDNTQGLHLALSRLEGLCAVATSVLPGCVLPQLFASHHSPDTCSILYEGTRRVTSTSHHHATTALTCSISARDAVKTAPPHALCNLQPISDISSADFLGSSIVLEPFFQLLIAKENSPALALATVQRRLIVPHAEQPWVWATWTLGGHVHATLPYLEHTSQLHPAGQTTCCAGRAAAPTLSEPAVSSHCDDNDISTAALDGSCALDKALLGQTFTVPAARAVRSLAKLKSIQRGAGAADGE